MAMKNRKLFPSLTALNQSTDCSGFCDPVCPYNCYPYSDYDFLSPPPPPPPPPSISAQEHHISPYVIVIVSLIAGFFVLVSYYVIIAKSWPGWCCWRNNRQPEGEEDNADQEFLDENRVDHPIWLITTVGLQQSIINSITVCKYKKGEGLIEGTECSVCLSEFRQDETLRLLPKCNHAFHISCIDTWLRSHTNCPLCRAHIVNDAVNIPLVSVNQSPDNSNTVVGTRMQNSQNHDDIGNNQDRNELCENRAASEEGAETPQPSDERTTKDDMNSNANGDIEIVCHSNDHYQNVKNGIQPIKRSFSMDSLTAATTYIGLVCQESEGSSVDQITNTETTPSRMVLNQNGGCSSPSKLMSSSAITQCLHKSPVPMKRSFSCAERFFLSRHNRSLNSILPL